MIYNLFLKLFFISLSLQIYHSIILSFFFFKKKLRCIWLILFQYIYIYIYIFEIKDRKTILFSSDVYYSNFCTMCYRFFFFLQLKFLSSKLIIWISHSLKNIIMITKLHHKFTIDITQIIYRDIQIHNHFTSKISKN